MKDIKNYKLSQVGSALERLSQAVARLETVAGKTQASAPTGADSAALQEKLDRLTQDHVTLKDTAGRVAQRLDAAIGQISASLKD